jgi:hypothetical protein
MTVLLFCEVIRDNELFHRYWSSMSEDISYRITTSLVAMFCQPSNNPNPSINSIQSRNKKNKYDLF